MAGSNALIRPLSHLRRPGRAARRGLSVAVSGVSQLRRDRVTNGSTQYAMIGVSTRVVASTRAQIGSSFHPGTGLIA